MQEQALILHASTVRLDAGALVPGVDLALSLAISDGVQAPDGTYVGDYLSAADAAAIDASAMSLLDGWRGAVAPALSHRETGIADVWEVELFAEVFLPAVRLAVGVHRAALKLRPAKLVLKDGDQETAEFLRNALPGVPVELQGCVDPVSFPRLDAAPPSMSTKGSIAYRAATWAIRTLGVPSGRQKGMAAIPYGPTVPVIEQLAESTRLPALLYPTALPRRELITKLVRRGAWIAAPGALQCRRSHSRLAKKLDAAETIEVPQEVAAVGRALHQQALRMLRQRAGTTLAELDALHGAFQSGQISVVVLPFDQAPAGRQLAFTARQYGIRSLTLQHGYQPLSYFREGSQSDCVGVWSRLEEDPLSSGHRDVRVVGNPLLERPTTAQRRQAPKPRGELRALLLTQGTFRVSALIGDREPARHVEAAVTAARAAGIGHLIIRPHPADPLGQYERVAAALEAQGIELSVNRSAPLRELLASSDLLIGALSTGTLEAALFGLPVVVLDLTGQHWHAPLDSSGVVPRATDARQLADLLEQEGARGPNPEAAEELLEALGATVPRSLQTTLEWIIELAK